MKATQLLSKSIAPKHYKILISPNIDSGRFTGKSTILLNVFSNLQHINFNSVGLNYTKISLSQDGRKIYDWPKTTQTKFEEIKADEVVRLRVDLHPGEATIKLFYEGLISNELRGFYKANYVDETGVTQTIGVTQFEPVHARRAFPCWDEPSFKAIFSISLNVEKSLLAVSNMPVKTVHAEESPSGQTVTYHFADTPLMSTYLVAFVVGNLSSVESKFEKIKVRVYTEPKSIEKAKFALEAAIKFLDYYQKYFELEYPIGKLDLVAVPDFACGAMENWGLVTFRDTSILCDENSSQKAKERVAIVVAHELAHQWFGNLVTMSWWTHLWLNEGFASFMEVKATDEIFPRWQILEEFISDQLSHAMFLDSFESSHAIEVDVLNPNDIDEIFDAISYEKGALVVRMVHDFIGPDVFKQGIRSYFTDYRFGNADTNDLWEKLGEASGKDVRNIMSGFTTKKGYPLIHVEETQEGKLLLRQQKFETRTRKALEGDSAGAENDFLWKVPILNDRGESFLMDEKQKDIEIPNKYIINYQASGFYRTLFSRQILQKIDLRALPVLNLFMLLNDTFAAVYLGDYGNICDLFGLMESLEEIAGDSVVVWKEMCRIMSLLGSVFQASGEDAIYDKFRKFSIGILSKKYEALGWGTDSPEPLHDKKQRVETLATLSEFDHEKVISEGKTLFKEYLYQNRDPSEEIKKIIFEIGCKFGNERDCETLKAKAMVSSNTMERINTLKALGKFKDECFILKMLNSYKTGEVRTQDFGYVSYAVAYNIPIGSQIAWKWFQENYSDLRKTFSGTLFADFVSMLNVFATNEMAAEIEAFFATQNTEGCERKLLQTLENIRIKADFVAKCKADAKKWLDEKLK